MKKIATLFLFLSLTVFGYSQVNFGLKAGLNFTTLSGTIDDAGLQVKLHAGMMIKIRLADKVFFQPELLVSGQGAKDINEDGEFRFTYLNAPLLFRFMVSDKVSLHVGPQFGLLLSSKYRDYRGFVSERIGTQTSDYGITFGGAYHFNENLALSSHLYWGLMDIDTYSPNSEMYNRLFQISLEYVFK